jgi:hypothetical protein
VSGPYDSEAKSRKIVDTLRQRCGADGFHFMVALDGPEELDDWAGAEDDGEEEEVIEGELGAEDRGLGKGEPKRATSWLRRLPPFRR